MKFLVPFLLALFVAAPVLADKDSCSVISNAFNPTEAGATDDIFNLTDGTFSATAADEDEFIVPVQVRVSSLRFDVDVAPGASDIWLLTINDDAVATGVEATIVDTDTDSSAGFDNFEYATIAAGSDITLTLDSSTGAGDPAAAAEVRFSFVLCSEQ